MLVVVTNVQDFVYFYHNGEGVCVDDDGGCSCRGCDVNECTILCY